MKHSRLALISVVFLLLICRSSYGQHPKISYQLAMPNPWTHLFEVEIRLESLPQEKSIDFILPVWRPGLYMIFDFASGVRDFAAFGPDERPLKWQKTEKSKWHVETNKASSVSVRYRVYANEFNMRTRGLNDEHGFVDGTAVFMYVDRYRTLPLTLEVKPYEGWHVTTGLEGTGNEFTAPSYDYFVDCPIEIGTQKDFPFTVDGVSHVLSFSAPGNWNADTLISGISKIVKTQKDFWGEFPYKRYVFLVHCIPNPGGATEHINSTILQTRPYGFGDHGGNRGFLGMVSHEYFHTWNVKQLRPRGINPYDFTKENYSRELWVAEGMTSYFSGILMVRAGYTTPAQYVEGIAGTVQGDRQRPGNSVQPVSEASFDQWVMNSHGYEQSYNAQSDIYGKGANVSGLLDLQIRKSSGNKHSLEDVIRAMYKRFPLSGKGYTLKDLQSVAEEFSGEGLQKFFDDYVFGAKPLPWEELLTVGGIELTAKDSTPKAWVGIGTNDMGERTRITSVVAGSPAEDAGLELGDELLALGGYRMRSGDFIDRISGMKPGESITLTVFHNDRIRELRVKVGSSPVPAYVASKVKNPSAGQKAVFESWLKTAW